MSVPRETNSETVRDVSLFHGKLCHCGKPVRGEGQRYCRDHHNGANAVYRARKQTKIERALERLDSLERNRLKAIAEGMK